MRLTRGEHEQVVSRRGTRSGAEMVVAIHSTTLGPALGGVRMWSYAAPEEGLADALRLSRAMTLKAAAAGLDLGGGKGVIRAPNRAPPEGRERRAILLDFAAVVESLGGRYITAEDVGTSPDDLAVIAEATDHVTGLPVEHGGAGDPSPITALGVEAAMRACLRERFGSDSIDGCRIVVIGPGHVGEPLSRRLAGAGADLVLSDIDDSKRALAAELGAEWVDPAGAVVAECDVLAPCALGGAIDADNAGRLRCEIVCGSANNQLADERLDERLEELGVLYAPDFIANAGGLIHVCGEVRGYSAQRARELATGIEETMAGILEASAARGITPLRAAHELARERLGSTREPAAAA